jgi:type 1 fimbriae regulatory protein FimB/type 1 fimbriae regulatory protein FimE
VSKVVAFRGVKKAAPDNIFRKVPRRWKNRAVRSREHLLPNEVEALMKAAGQVGRHRLRDRTLILVTYRHGLRVSELVALRWDQIDFQRALMHVNRLKNGTPATHPISGDELRLLRRLRREYPETPFVFVTERGGPLTTSTVSKLISRAGQEAKLPFPCHPHMLRHGTGYYLANKGIPTRNIQAYLGHRAIQHTVRYTELSSAAFKGLWD